MTDIPRLIEFAFPLKQASLDSVHEKNVRHGHISTLHIWPARRPLAACRAALIATLLPDPGTPEKRRELCEKIGGKVVKRIERKKMPGGQIVEREKEETEGGILHWGRETENAETLQWFRDEIKKAYGGRAPKVLDPFAGGGAIPLEAMRLGCEATAIDINPVAWFILKCTLEYPQRLAGQKRPLPAFVLKNREFMESFFKAQGHSKAQIRALLKKLGTAVKDDQQSFHFDAGDGVDIGADLAWHVRAWGQWVLERARRELAKFYPVYADFEPLDKTVHAKSYERQPMRLVPPKDDGTPDIDALNAEFSEEYLSVKTNPRWIAKPTVAYLWARTVTCKNCRATVPLLKTLWLARTTAQRVLLRIQPARGLAGVEFAVDGSIPRAGANNAQRREHDRRIGDGTMSRAGVRCLCCKTITTLEDIQVEGKAGRLGRVLTAVATSGPKLKEFRHPTELECQVSLPTWDQVERAFEAIPFGLPDERLVEDAKRNTWCVQYGIDRFSKLFTERQLIALGTLTEAIRTSTDQAARCGYPNDWREAIRCYLACSMSRLSDFFNCGAQWKLDRATINHLFVRYALPVSWDFAEGNALGDLPGSHNICLRKIAVALDTFVRWTIESPPAHAVGYSSISCDLPEKLDAIVTDPPYYNAIGYAVLMDYFYVWLRRQLHGLSDEFDEAFREPLSPKWDRDRQDGELVDDASRHSDDQLASKATYEQGMERVFHRCAASLNDSGRLVIVFAHKAPDAWEALVAAIIRSGFVVDGSWPIQTEQAARMRAQASSALASSVWLVCKKRPVTARPGWDNKVLEEMRTNIGQRLRDFWDAGIRGPDFVWAATGPALEAYSKHPVVKMANEPNAILSVSEFLNHARRMVVDFVVGRVLSRDDADGEVDGEGETRRHGDAGSEGVTASPGHRVSASSPSAASSPHGDQVGNLDQVTAYYLLHRNDFNLDEAPVGACILYATACGLSDQELVRDWDLLVKAGDAGTGGGRDAGTRRRVDAELDNVAASDVEEDDDEFADADEAGTGGSKVKLKAWTQRRGQALGYEAPGGRPVPLIDRIHRLMQLWRAGDVYKVDEYLDEQGLRRHELFRRVLQSLIELAKHGSEERSLLESLSNHVGAKGARRPDPQKTFIAASAEQEGGEE